MTTWLSSDLSTPNHTTMPVVRTSLISLPLYQVAVSLWTFYYPILLLLGTFGNVMSIVIMYKMMTKQSTINLFFIALAAGDLWVLYSGIVMKWINVVYSLNIVNTWPALYYTCLYIYLSAVGSVSWILVSMTLQRAASVAWPHHVSRIFTRGRILKSIAGIAMFQSSLHSHTLYCVYATSATNLTGSECMRSTSLIYAWFLDNVFIYLAMVVNSLLPFLCLGIGNATLVVALIISVRQATSGNIGSGNSQKLSLKRQKDANSVTVTILVMSLTFIALTLPVFVYADLYQFRDNSDMSVEEKAGGFLFYSVSSLLVSTNSAINFYLYCLTGRRFREEFVKVLSCGVRKVG